MIRRCLLLAGALVATACTDALEIPEPTTSGTADTIAASTTATTSATPYELVAPDPDPTPIEVSGEVRIGTLDNGITYYVRSNQSPGNGLSLRLAVDAGSLQQEEPESGAAHFLEHMLFNGTENFPGNELARALQRIGVAFGADLNAYTSFDETVYQLDLASVTDETVDIGFDVLADWAAAATISQDGTVAERGVVREEIRLRDEGPDGVVATAFNRAYLRGTPYEDREPGGRGDLILETDAEELRAFYDRWYRPELMAVIAVGDRSADELEARIRERFAELEARGDGAERQRPTVEPIDTPLAEVVTHPELASTFISIDYSLTDWGTATVGGERLTLIQELFALMIRDRLRDAAQRGEVDLDEPFVTRFEQTRAHAFLGFNFDAVDRAAATEYVLSEMRRLELTGFTENELARATSQFRTILDQSLAAAPTTQDRTFADTYTAHFLDGTQIASAAATHERLTAALDELTASEVTDVFRWELSRAAPLVIAVGPDPSELPTVAELEAAIEAADLVVAEGPAGADELAVEQLMERPTPAEVVETNDVSELGGTEWVFANGVTVRHVRSDIAANQVDLAAVSEGGWSLLDADDAALAPHAVVAVQRSGIGDLDRVDLRRFLAGVTTGLSPFIDETSEGFFGGSGADDVEILFQLLHLAVTQPRIDELALIEVLDDADDQRRSVASDPGLATLNAVVDARFDGDQRFALVPPSLDGLTSERALDIYRGRLGTVDDLEVAIVGAIDADVVEELAAAYLGTLPAGEPDTWVNVRAEPLDAVISREVVAGSGDATGTVAVLYPSIVAIDAPTRVELLVLESILGTRLLDVVREELGASYGGSARSEVTDAPTEGIDLLLFANIDPARGPEILDVILAQAVDVAANGPTADELERARSVIQSDFDLVGNGELIEMLLTEPDEEVLTYERRSQLLAEVDADSIRQLAATVLSAGARIEVITSPAAGTG